MKRVLEKQNIYDARHYRTYSERALHVTNLLWELASSEGTEIEPIDGLTENFSSMIYNYYGYQFAITHGLDTLDIEVAVYEVATGAKVETDITRLTTSAVTIGFAVAPVSGETYRVVVQA